MALFDPRIFDNRIFDVGAVEGYGGWPDQKKDRGYLSGITRYQLRDIANRAARELEEEEIEVIQPPPSFDYMAEEAKLDELSLEVLSTRLKSSQEAYRKKLIAKAIEQRIHEDVMRERRAIQKRNFERHTEDATYLLLLN